MKVHSNDYKTTISNIGKQLDSKITYTIDNETIELGGEELNSITPHYKGDILKSVMKQLDIDSNVDIPVGTVINYQFGVKVGDTYEYLDFGNYIVNSSEKQEDLRSYQITAYDKMLLSMKDYENMSIIYPISLRNYLGEICNYLGITFASSSDNFANYNRMIQSELYLSNGESMGYKFRDVLDEIAQATGSIICINANDELEVRYITQTNDTIDEDFFKDVNVNFGEKYGPINSIVLSRSGGADNVYLQDQESITQNGLCELKIQDNQIMNGNDRSDYLPDLLTKLDGLEYYLNDFASPGITYYDIGDRYTVHIGDNYYSCVMFNDEILVTQGLEENIYTERPIPSETDYSKADKTDRRINQTYLIVDKQNQTIESVVSNVGVQDEKISQITQTVNEINSKISDIADITTSAEDTDAVVELQEINTSEPIQIKIHPTGTNISYLYPSTNLYPSEDLYMRDRRIRFHNTTTDENFDFILPDDLLYYDSEHYDEFLLDYGDGTPQTQLCQVTKRCKYNADGTVSLLSQEETTNYTYPSIPLTDGDYEVSIYGYQQGYIFTRLMAKNIYTTQFYTKAETNTLLDQTATSITASVNQTLSNYSTTSEMNAQIQLTAQGINTEVAKKVGNDEVISKINQSAEQISIDANKLNLTGYITATNLATSGQTVINGDNITTGVIKSENYVANTSGTKLDLSNGVIDSKNFKLASNGNATFKGLINGGSISVQGSYDEDDPYVEVRLNDSVWTRIWNNGISVVDYSMDDEDARIRTEGSSGYAELHNQECNAFEFNNISLAEKKENFEKLEKALEIIKSTDIYKYHYKNEKRKKKHIGLVIGDKYNYSKELTNEKNDSVDLYSMIGVCFKAIQEQQEEIEKLKEVKQCKK